MGSGRDKRKKAAKRVGKDGSGPSGDAKTSAKTDKNAAKLERRMAKAAADDDIDALLANIKLMDSKLKEVDVHEDCPKPGPRCNCSFTPTLAQKPKPAEVIMFGGECVDAGGKTQTFGDLFRYDVDRNRWTKVVAPNAPPPRSAHQAVVHGGYLYVFGGEFTSPNQEKFHHYRDLWRLDLEEHAWENITPKIGPSARSGHRMVAHPKGKSLLLFGGFYDTGDDIRYYNDVWELTLETMTWRCGFGGDVAGGAKSLEGPSPRSASHLSVVGESLWVYGGYRKFAGDGEGDDGDVEKGTTHSDLWRMDLKTWRWEKQKKTGMAPGPRAGATSATHGAKKRHVLFGGVVDHEIRKGEVIISEFFNDAYSMSLDNGRWYPVCLYADKGSQPEAPREATGREEAERVARGEVVNENFNVRDATVRAAIKIQAHYRGYAVRKAYKLYRIGGQVSELLYSPGSGEAAPKTAPRPRGRMNAALAVRGNVMYLFGGAVEIGDVEVALDDVWALELTARPRWRKVAEYSPEVAGRVHGEAVESSDDEDEDTDTNEKGGEKEFRARKTQEGEG